ncbi:MAG: hypothetical protein FE040_01360 [Thermoplasmata archaeon]|nr:MAG: hypothetical protein FE040_01360 [Thermoplasmata archaeon]MCD6146944.1 hypothetical protein [Thermoplasmata archaeon]
MAIPYGLHLQPGEKILWQGKMSWKSLWVPLLAGILSVWIYGLGVLFLAYAAAKWLKTDYAVTDKRVIKIVRHYSFLYLADTDIFEIKRDDVNDEYVAQTLMGKKFDFGDIVFISPKKKVVFKGLNQPYDALEKMKNTI